MKENSVVILGAGLTGLSAASVLGNDATVLENTDRPGWFVKAVTQNVYGLDHVLHLRQITPMKKMIKQVTGVDPHPIFSEAWIEMEKGKSDLSNQA